MLADLQFEQVPQVPMLASLRTSSGSGGLGSWNLPMPTVTTLDNVREEVAGSVILPRQLFERVLGVSGTRTFTRMRGARSALGFIEATYPELAVLAGHDVVGWETIRRGARRLTAFGLLARVMDLQVGRKRLRLYGAAGRTGEGMDVIITPREAAKKIKASTAGWGGARVGSGSKQNTHNNLVHLNSQVDSAVIEKSSAITSTSDSSVPEPRFKRTRSQDSGAPTWENTQRFQVLSSRFKCTNQPLFKCTTSRAHAGASVINYIPKVCIVLSSKEDTLQRLATAGFFYIWENQTEAHSMGDESPDHVGEDGIVVTPEDTAFEEAITDVTTLFSKPGNDLPTTSNDLLQCVPAYPGSDIIRVAKVPAPPLIDTDLDDLERVSFLARVYTKAVDSRYPKAGGTFFKVLKMIKNARKAKTDGPREKLKRSRHYMLLHGAVEELVKHSIPPGSWITFAMDVWVEYGDASRDTSTPPLPQYVFAKKHFENWRGWFRSESGRYSGGKLLFTQPHQELMQRYRDMQRELHFIDGTNPRAVNTVIDTHFPDELYDELIAAANNEGKIIQGRLRKLLSRGEWLWNDGSWGM